MNGSDASLLAISAAAHGCGVIESIGKSSLSALGLGSGVAVLFPGHRYAVQGGWRLVCL